MSKYSFLLIHIGPSPFEITSTSTGPPTVSRESEICLLKDVKLTNVSATFASSGSARVRITPSIGLMNCNCCWLVMESINVF